MASKSKICNKCRVLKTPVEFGPNICQKDGLQTYCKSCRIPYARERYKKRKNFLGLQSAQYKFRTRMELFKKLGVKCENTNLYNLQIDHVNNNGNLERKKYGKNFTRFLMKKYLNGEKNIKELQILCANCNQEKALRQLKFLPKIIQDFLNG